MSIYRLVHNLFPIVNRHFKDGEPMTDIQDFLKTLNLEKTINECFKFFYEEFKNRVGTDMVRLSLYRDKILEICYIDIVAEKDEDAYTIFEVLNARGQELSDFELLRNYLIKYSTDSEKESVKTTLEVLEKSLGKDIDIFLKHYVMHKYGQKTDKNKNRPYKVITNKEKSNITKLIEDLTLKATYYKKITEYNNCSPLEYKIFSFFKSRNQRQFRPIVMGMMHQNSLHNISYEDYEKYLEYLYEFFICYCIIGEQRSNKIEDIVYGYSYKIENDFSSELLKHFQVSMAERIPNKKNFAVSIKRIRYSHKYKAYSDSSKRDNVFAIYELLEKELGYKGTFDNISIEHCNPDSESEDNANIGNLMLLEECKNNSCKDKSLAQKIEYYNDSSLCYPKIIRDQFLKSGQIDYEQNSDMIADILYKRIKGVTLLSK